MNHSFPYRVLLLLIALATMIPAAGQSNQTVQNGVATAPVVFPSGCSFSWTCDHPEIGLAASGSGNIASFTAVNSGTTPITATITAIPTNVTTDYAYVNSMYSSLIHVINTSTNTIVATLTPPLVVGEDATAFSPDMSTLYIAGNNGVDAVNTSTNAMTHIWTGVNLEFYYSVVVSLDGSTLYVVENTKGTLYRIDVATGTTTGTLGIGAPGLRAVLSPDGTRLYAINGYGSISVIDVTTFTVINTINLPGVDQNIVISPDGKTLYASATITTGNIYVISTVTNSITGTIPFTGSGGVINLSPDGSRLYVSNQATNTVTVINTAAQAVLATIPVSTFPTGLELDPVTGHLYVIGYEGTVDVINLSTNTVITTIPVPNGQAQFTAGNFIYHSGCAGTPVTMTITVNPSSPAILSNLVTGMIAACAGVASASPAIQQFTVKGNYLTGNITATAPAGFELSLSSGTGFGASLTLSPTAATVGPATIYVRAAATAPAGSISGNVVLSSPGASDQDVAVTGTVTGLVTPSISINTSANNICAGSAVTFTATPSNQGSAPIYQWTLNGAATGTNSPGFSSSSLNNGDQVSCQLISNITCVTSASAASTPITMQVTSLVTPGIVVAPSANNICAGTAVTFTATPTNGGTVPGYQWLLNGSNTGANSSTFTTNTLSTTDEVSCILTSNAGCLAGPTATSAPVSVMVTSQKVPTVIIAPATAEICAGTSITFKATVSNGGFSIAYQWTLNGSNVGNDPTYTNAGLQDGDQVVCIATGNMACGIAGSSTPSQIVVDPLPTVTFWADPVYKATSGVQLTPIITGTIASYQWSPAAGLSNIDIADPIADPMIQQTYQLRAITDKGCVATGEITVIPRSPLALPGAFTPNNDGHNDLFRIPTGAPITLDQFAVFNRWGVEVFTTRDPNTGWDGTSKGQPAPAGTYVYVIKGKNAAGKAIAIRGTVVLVR